MNYVHQALHMGDQFVMDKIIGPGGKMAWTPDDVLVKWASIIGVTAIIVWIIMFIAILLFPGQGPRALKRHGSGFAGSITAAAILMNLNLIPPIVNTIYAIVISILRTVNIVS